MNEFKEIFIAGNVPSSKNSRINTSRGSFASKTVTKYLRGLGIQSYSSSKKTVTEYKTRENIFKCIFEDAEWVKPDKCIVLGFHFVRGGRRRWDFHNIVQCVADLLTAHDYIVDDDMDWLVPMPYKRDGKWYSYDKVHPGVYIKIIEEEIKS